MTNRLGARVVFLSLLGATGCGGGDDLLLGHAELTNDAGSEQPIEEDAGGEAPAPTPDAGSARTCKGDLAGRPKVELFVRDIPDATCDAPRCEFQPSQLKVAGDGSVWIAGNLLSGNATGNWQLSVLWIGHYSAAGEPLGSARVKSDGSRALLAVDDQDRAWLLAAAPGPGPASYLYRFDENVRELSSQMLPTVYVDLVRYPQYGVLLSGAGRALQAIGYDARELWSATEPRNPGMLAADDMGRIVLASHEASDDPQRNDPVLIEWFGQGGSPRPDSPPSQITFGEELRLGDSPLMVAAEELTLAYVTVPRLGGGLTRHLERRDAMGALKWSWETSGHSDHGLAVDPITGTILTLGGSESVRGLALVAISPDGKQCRQFGIDGPAYGFLSLGPKGEIWFVTNGAPNGYKSRFGRLERPDLRW